MTPHLDEGRIEELIDGEIPSADLPPIQAHLAACAECRARLEEARAIVAGADQLIETIDLEPRPATVGASVAARPPELHSRRRGWGRNLAWAATLILAAGTGYLARGREPVPTPAPAALEQERAALPPPAPPAELADRPSPEPVPTGRRDNAARAMGPASSAPRDGRKPAAPGFAKQHLAGALDSMAPRGKLAADANVIAGVTEEKSSTKSKDSASGRDVLSQPEVAATSTRESAKKALALAPPTPAPGRLQSAPSAVIAPVKEGLKLERRADEAAGLGAASLRQEPPVELTVSEARRRLGGELHFIEGLSLIRIEGVGVEVRVVYPLATGELLLVQRLVDGKIDYRLVAPRDFPPDSLARLRDRVRE